MYAPAQVRGRPALRLGGGWVRQHPLGSEALVQGRAMLFVVVFVAVVSGAEVRLVARVLQNSVLCGSARH